NQVNECRLVALDPFRILRIQPVSRHPKNVGASRQRQPPPPRKGEGRTAGVQLPIDSPGRLDQEGQSPLVFQNAGAAKAQMENPLTQWMRGDNRRAPLAECLLRRWWRNRR